MKQATAIFIIDPPERLDPPTDTSLALMREAVRRGCRVSWCTLANLRLENGRPRARVKEAMFASGEELFRSGGEMDCDLSRASYLFMRKDPPVDSAYLHATLILDRLSPEVVQVNPAQALRDHCEKLIPTRFADLAPENVMTNCGAELDRFLEQVGHIVLKPVEECSGRGIFTLVPDDPNRRSLFEQVTRGGTRFIQAQRFLPEISAGDKRVLLLGGEILGWVRRVPSSGDFRSNVNAGARCEPCELTESDRRICARIGPWLNERGIHLAGIDIVGEYVLEVNITSPSCLREINALTGLRLEEKILDYLERVRRI